MASTIRIERDDAKWRDKQRDYEVVLDGSVIGAVANGDVFESDVDPGGHTVRVKVGFIGSKEIAVEVPSGSTVSLQCSPAGQQGGAIKQSFVSLFRRDAWINLAPLA